MLENKSGEPRFLRWFRIIDIKKDVCKDISQRAEDGTQTRDPQLGRLMLYRLSYFRIFLWAKMDSNHRRRKPADLQSAPFGHSGTCPFQKVERKTGLKPATLSLEG